MSKSSVKRKIEHSADHQGEVTKCKGNDLEERKQTKNSTGRETRETRGSLKKGSDQDAGQSGVSSSKKMRKNVTSARIVEDNEYVNFYTVIERKEVVEKANAGDMMAVIVTRID